jgi:hypothetical protein
MCKASSRTFSALSLLSVRVSSNQGFTISQRVLATVGSPRLRERSAELWEGKLTCRGCKSSFNTARDFDLTQKKKIKKKTKKKKSQKKKKNTMPTARPSAYA